MAISDKIKHVVVLMLENRSLDHLCGYMRFANPQINGVTGTEFNDLNPGATDPGRVMISDDAPYVPDLNPGPGHDVRDVHIQMYVGGTEITNLGFVYDYGQQPGVNAGEAGRVMQCFSPQNVPALTSLVNEFALCDAWHSSVPGPTWPNRLFAHCATSGGFIDNNPRQFPMVSIFERLSDLTLDSWRVYFHDISQVLTLVRLRNARYLRFFEHFEAFLRDCQDGTLPTYSFIEPRYFSILGAAANDQHPDHGIVLGDQLIAQVYNAVRASKQWQESLLVVTWDEHGGFYDHVPPPKTVNPDGMTSPEFDFTLLGIRVPAVIVSPWVPAGTVDHTLYDHASIPATLKTIFGTGTFLTERDRYANTFDKNCSLDVPRSDAPASVVPAQQRLAALHTTIQQAASQQRPPTDLQRSLISLANDLSPVQAQPQRSIVTEMQGAAHVHRGMSALLSA